MREDVLNEIIEKMSTDPDFMNKLQTKPGKALFEAGLSWEEVAEIKKAAVEGPQTEALGERSSAGGLTVIGKLWVSATGSCGCLSSWTGLNTSIVPFCT